MLTSEVPFLPFYFFTFLPLNKSLLLEGFDKPNADRKSVV